MNKFKRRITRIAGTALLPAALAVGVAAPASAQAAATPPVAAHAATHQDHNYYYGWQYSGYSFYSYDQCHRYGYEYYSQYQFKCVYTYSDYGYYYWQLWVYYPYYSYYS